MSERMNEQMNEKMRKKKEGRNEIWEREDHVFHTRLWKYNLEPAIFLFNLLLSKNKDINRFLWQIINCSIF